MQLGPTDEERLKIFQVAQLARRALDRDLALNAPEAIGLVCDEMHLAARAGASYAEVVEVGRRALREDQVMRGVADIVPEIRVEVLLEEGTRLIVLREPFGPASAEGPGAIRLAEGDVELGEGRERRRISVTNTSRRPIRVTSHFPFARTNPALEFDREAARGFRLDIPAGDAVRWGPGESIEVDLVDGAEDIADAGDRGEGA